MGKKSPLETQYPKRRPIWEHCKVTLSCPTLRTDDGLANAKLVQVKNRLKRSGVSIIDNERISYDDISLKGLHLKPSGTRKLAGNMIAHMKRL